MCIFSQPVELVSNTHIFARVANGAQFLAYELKLSTTTENAMILPVPVAHGAGEDALQFISLEDYPDFFDDLDALFPAVAVASAGLDLSLGEPAHTMLRVHRVGSFEASFVPTIPDFSRLDPRFNLSPEAWEALPQVQDYGFAVFQLVAGRDTRVHPMAFSFPTRSPDRIVFPTIHVHDGEVHERAGFDHKLFCQHDAAGEVPLGRALPSLQEWDESMELPESSLDLSRTGGLIVEGQWCYRMTMWGTYDNEDVVMDLPAIRAEAISYWDQRPEEEREIFLSNQAMVGLFRSLVEEGGECPKCGLHSRGYELGIPERPGRAYLTCRSCGESSFPSEFGGHQA